MNRSQIRRVSIGLAVGFGMVALAAPVGWSQDQAAPSKPSDTHKHEHAAKINEPFRKPDVKEYVKRFETESRENYALRHEIVASLGLEPGMAVADIGAGTGLFTRLFAEQAGPTGKVYAVDISQPFLDHIARDAKAHKQKQVVTVRCSQDSTNLPAQSVDVAFLSDVYHHLEKPDKTLASIRRALRPRGRLVVIEFDRVEGRSSAFVLSHVRASQAVFRKEIEDAGFFVVPNPKAPKLKENFFLTFEKTVK